MLKQPTINDLYILLAQHSDHIDRLRYETFPGKQAAVNYHVKEYLSCYFKLQEYRKHISNLYTK